jgi:hypothetical protein
MLPCKETREVGAFYFEATRPGEAFIERDVMQQCCDGENLAVVLDVLQLSEPHRKQP